MSDRFDVLSEFLDRAITLRERAEYHEAILFLSRILDERPISEMFYERGYTYSAMGEHESAIADFTRGIQLRDDDPDLYVARGNAYLHLKNYECAAADYSAAIPQAPSTTQAYAYAYNGRGWANWQMGLKQAAIDDLQRAISADEHYVSPRYNLALILSSICLCEEALLQIGKAIELSPNDASLHCLRADINKELSNILESQLDCRRAIAADSTDFESRWRLAWLLSTTEDGILRDGAEALAHATIACDATEWRQINSLKSMAAALAECGRFHEAIECQAKAVSLSNSADRDYAQRVLDQLRSGLPVRVKTSAQIDRDLLDSFDALAEELSRWQVKWTRSGVSWTPPPE